MTTDAHLVGQATSTGARFPRSQRRPGGNRPGLLDLVRPRALAEGAAAVLAASGA
ncbi:MAG TPA: hypothetical protein VMU95_16330 [Trebonia sp.]|nr:hypothetical protein [Trebonia sp.]